jgi:hypothetical protein
MELGAVIGVTSGSLTNAQTVTQEVLAVKDIWIGIRDVDESTKAFTAKLEAFHFASSIDQRQLSR